MLINVFSKPFPLDEDWRSTARSILLISIFVTIFLYVFRPFGLDGLEEDTLMICAGFGAMTLVASLAVEASSRLMGLKTSSVDFTFGKWIVHIIFVLLAISLANFLFIRLAIFGDIRWEFFPYMIRGTVAVGIFPVVVLGGLAMLQLERRHRTIATEINNYSPKGIATKPKALEIYGISSDQIRYVEALQNYVQIGYTAADGNFKQLTERTTLKQLVEQLQETPIVKCHRSYLVNKNEIRSVEGNAQGLLLTISDCDKQIPVSRSLVPIFRHL